MGIETIGLGAVVVQAVRSRISNGIVIVRIGVNIA
jgi:hypothetical protein